MAPASDGEVVLSKFMVIGAAILVGTLVGIAVRLAGISSGIAPVVAGGVAGALVALIRQRPGSL